MTINLENISFDHCIKCTVCTVYCPVARASALFPGPKQSGPDAERLRIKNPELLDESLKYCSNCKRCEIACPSDVKIPDIIQNAKWNYTKGKIRLRDFLLSRTDLLGQTSTRLGPLVNMTANSKALRRIMDLSLGISSQRIFPSYENGTFAAWFRSSSPSQDKFDEKAIYFHGCYVNYNNHDLGRDVVKVMNALNVGVIVVNEKCCGTPLIANGYMQKAKKNARFNLNSLAAAAQSHDAAIISSSSTCAMTLKHEYPGLLDLDNSAIADRLDYITRFISRKIEQNGAPDMKPLNLTVVYHVPCHLERMGGALDTIDLLQSIPGVDLKLIHSECCGISGTYGFKSELYDISQKIGEDVFKRIDEVKPDVVVTDCETCKWQIEMNTPYETLHPVTLMARALGE